MMRSVKLLTVSGFIVVLAMSYLAYVLTQHDFKIAVLLFCSGVLWVSLISLGTMWMVKRSLGASREWVERQGHNYNCAEFRFFARGPYTSFPFNFGQVIKANVSTKREETKVVWLKWSGYSLVNDPEVTWE